MFEKLGAAIAQLVEQRTCNAKVPSSILGGGTKKFRPLKSNVSWKKLEGCPSGQREQTVNLPAMPTLVQIQLPPPQKLDWNEFLAVNK